MKFDWNNFSEATFDIYKEKYKDTELYVDTYLGCARVGELCFDFVTRI